MRSKLLILALSLLPLATFAASSACPEHYAAGKAPDIVNHKLAAETRELCSKGFGVMHSGVSRTPLWSAEHLTRANLENAHDMERRNAFHVDTRLPASERADLKDYARSGFDRGHMAPSGDMPDEASQFESFALSNMVPQNPNNNRHLWEGIESAVRKLAIERGELYVLTGPLFRGSELKRIQGHVLVPSHLFKVVFDPRTKEAGAYLVENTDTKAYQRISIADLEQLAGINLLPGLAIQTKATVMALPASHPYARKRR